MAQHDNLPIPAIRNLAVGSAAAYEQLLAQDLGWAMTEGSLFFEGGGAVQETLRRITARLDELGIDYAIAGGMALFVHGFRRFTEDVDILVTSDGLKRLHRELDGRGYVPPFERSKNLRDTETKVKIKFLVANQYPGDGKPKAVAFPDPSQVFEIRDGIKVLNLPTLVTVKLASGISGGPDRAKDLVDVGELINALRLHEGFAERLDESVKDKFTEIWRGIYGTQRRYVRIWHNQGATAHAASPEQMIEAHQSRNEELARMLADGVRLDPISDIDKDNALLVTTSREIAEKYGFHDESEILLDDDSAQNDSGRDEANG